MAGEIAQLLAGIERQVNSAESLLETAGAEFARLDAAIAADPVVGADVGRAIELGDPIMQVRRCGEAFRAELVPWIGRWVRSVEAADVGASGDRVQGRTCGEEIQT